ncbi:hypothetical protein MUK42_18179, partial [Musa troglodytarum]
SYIDAWLISHITNFVYRTNLIEKVIHDNLELLLVTTPFIVMVGLQFKTIVLPQDHITVTINPIQWWSKRRN